MPALVDYLELAESDEKKLLLRHQWAEAVSDRRVVTCPCGQPRALELAFRCLYCGAWFCAPCAEAHFGQTMLEWKQKKRAEQKLAERRASRKDL